MANDIVYVYPALLLGGANVFFNLKLMSAERPKFLLDVVTRVDPQANICTFFMVTFLLLNENIVTNFAT